MKVYVVHGSPLSGKSTYVEKYKGPNDLIYDFDLIMSAISGKPMHEDNKHLIEYVTDIRDLLITKLKSEKDIDTAWIITTRVSESLKRSLVGLNPTYKETRVDIATAKRRLRDKPGGRDIEEYSEAIDKYFMKTKDYSDFYNTRSWKTKRVAVLKRDSYLCRECKRYGKVTGANTVHHILPLQERPDLKLDSKNLISLCEEHHNQMHNRLRDELSKLGKEWRDRTLRKYPELLTPP